MDGSATIPRQIRFVVPKPGAREVLVLGLGNILLGDDGIGVHVARRLAAHPGSPPGLRPLDGGTLGFRLMDAFARADAILLVDAAELGEPAGAVRLLERDALNRHVRRGGRVSAHEAGLVDLLTLAKLEGCAPAHLALLGIQPQRIDWDEALSVPLTNALPAACRIAIDTVLKWQKSP
jgi:hydrogenase maturation protease